MRQSQLKPPANDRASSCHSDAAREQQEANGLCFWPNRLEGAVIDTGKSHVIARLIKPIQQAIVPCQAGKLIPVYEITPESAWKEARISVARTRALPHAWANLDLGSSQT